MKSSLCTLIFMFFIPALVSAEPHPNKLLFLVFDQMRPEYIDRYNLKNFKRLRSISTEYQNAYVGDLPSITLISHPVMSMGILPKELPWKDELFFDQAGLLGAPHLLYATPKFTLEQFETLAKTLPLEQSLPAILKDKYHKKVFAVGEKAYAAITFGTPAADSIITLKKENGRCMPFGRNVPKYISEEDRFTIDCSKSYGTADSFYPIDGARLVPGDDPQHLGGDSWTFDVTKEIIEREDWAGLFVTFGGIDKIGHLLGEMDCEIVHPFNSEYNLKNIIQNADLQLGKLLDLLDRHSLLQKTLIVVTADHGSQTDRYYLGNANEGRSGELINDQVEEAPFWIKRLSKFAKIEGAAYDTAIRIWTKERNEQFERALAEISGVKDIFRLEQTGGKFNYIELSFCSKCIKKNQWDIEHNQELANSVASLGAPDYIALLEDNVGFGMLGDHGGAQEMVQRIPLFIHTPQSKPAVRKEQIRLVDIKKLVLERMKLDAP
jgi:hypothetical protein